MYDLPYFKEQDKETVLAFMRQYPFVFLSGVDENNKPVASQVPVFIDEKEGKLYLTGHIMKNTDHHKAFVKNVNVLVIFVGPHCHVSASWYPNPVQASTWNYMTVHAKGKISFKDEIQTKKIIEAITNKYESFESVAAFRNLSQEYVDRLVKAITGFTIEVENIDNVFKLSQNHEQETRQRIIEHLNENGSYDEKKIAAEMLQRIDIPKMHK